MTGWASASSAGAKPQARTRASSRTVRRMDDMGLLRFRTPVRLMINERGWLVGAGLFVGIQVISDYRAAALRRRAWPVAMPPSIARPIHAAGGSGTEAVS